MNENLNKILNNESEGRIEGKEGIIKLEESFTITENILATEGREKAKELLPIIYNELMALNKRDANDYQIQWIWNPEGVLSEEEFNNLNLHRKLLSNAIGIKCRLSDGTMGIRHDLNKI